MELEAAGGRLLTPAGIDPNGMAFGVTPTRRGG